jgi:hypothetical protein
MVGAGGCWFTVALPILPITDHEIAYLLIFVVPSSAPTVSTFFFVLNSAKPAPFTDCAAGRFCDVLKCALLYFQRFPIN